jgi:Sec-independent protein secretion pathway component TatC
MSRKTALIILPLGIFICLQPIIWWKIYMWASIGLAKDDKDALAFCCGITAILFIGGIVLLMAAIVKYNEKERNGSSPDPF